MMRLFSHAGVCACILTVATCSPSAAAADHTKITLHDLPPTDTVNSYYVSNRQPLLRNPLVKLPIGAIEPQGWLREQLVLESEGMIGHLDKLSRWIRTENSAWLDPQGQGEYPWEEVPYWLKGFGDLGRILDNQRIIDETRRWIDGVLAGQREDGYFGPEENRAEHPDLWPNMIMLYALRSWHEATGDERVIPFMTRYFRWVDSLPDEELLYALVDYSQYSWQKWRGADNLDSILWLYNRTGDEWLLDLARRNFANTADWDVEVAHWHGVNIAQGFRGPAQFYMLSHDTAHRDATTRNYLHIWSLYGQVPGGLFGADENCRTGHHGPRQGAETCTIVEFMQSCEMLMTQLGDNVWADRCEEVAYNMLPAALTPKLDGLHYLTAPNQIKLDKENKCPGIQNCGDMFAYSPREHFRCCQHNVSHGWPYFAEHLWMATHDNGLAAIFYPQSEVTARVADGREVTITTESDYPFSENIKFTIHTDQKIDFPLYLRIPAWCDEAKLNFNGVPIDTACHGGCYVRVERQWCDQDTLILQLPMDIRLTTWRANGDSVSVSRGPLTYSLKIGEQWQSFEQEGRWSNYEVLPTTPWNYGLVLDEIKSAVIFDVNKKAGPLADQPWTVDNAPIEIVTCGRRIPGWQEDHLGLVGPMQASPAKSDQPLEEITLIPMGCARLRISAFPVIGQGDYAVQWNKPVPPRHYANYFADDINAISDGIVPKSSADTNVPRMSFWPRKGKGEWVVYQFESPRTVKGCGLYWFDDRPKGGLCAVPAEWEIFYKKGDGWVKVENASGYPTEQDCFNNVSFEPVETQAIKVKVQNQPDYSGGILEWRIDVTNP